MHGAVAEPVVQRRVHNTVAVRFPLDRGFNCFLLPPNLRRKIWNGPYRLGITRTTLSPLPPGKVLSIRPASKKRSKKRSGFVPKPGNKPGTR